MKLVCQYIVIFFNFSLTANHLHPLQVENCDSNSRLLVDEDDHGKFNLKRVKSWIRPETMFSPDRLYVNDEWVYRGAA